MRTWASGLREGSKLAIRGAIYWASVIKWWNISPVKRKPKERWRPTMYEIILFVDVTTFYIHYRDHMILRWYHNKRIPQWLHLERSIHTDWWGDICHWSTILTDPRCEVVHTTKLSECTTDIYSADVLLHHITTDVEEPRHTLTRRMRTIGRELTSNSPPVATETKVILSP